VTVGYRAGTSGPTLFMVVPDTAGTMTMAYYNTATSRWIPIPGGAPSSATSVRPGLAYVPYHKQTTAGRFYLTWQPNGGGIRLDLTEGNDVSPTATKRRVIWQGPGRLHNDWLVTTQPLSLEFDLAYDDNLRAMFSTADSEFYPLADGIVNANLKDHDDFTVMFSKLACSLRDGC